MILRDFVKDLVEHNSIIRLVKKIPGGHEVVLNSWKDVDMAWRLSKGEGVFSPYLDREVIGVASIFSDIERDAVNIVIEL